MRRRGTVHDGLLSRILASGTPRQFVNISGNGNDMRRREGLATALCEGEIISIVPAVAGGGDENQGIGAEIADRTKANSANLAPIARYVTENTG